MAAERYDALVLDLDTRGGLCIARSLGRAGYRIAIGSRDGSVSGMRTRYARRRLVLPRPEDDFDAAADALLAYLAEQPTDAVLTSIDSSVELLDRRRAELKRLGTSPALASPEALAVTTSKERTLELARQLGIPVPRTARVTELRDLDPAIEEIGLPAVLKPDASWQDVGGGGERVAPLYVESLADARTVTAPLLAAGNAVLVQEVATGIRETLKFFRVGGRTLARLAMASSRTWPPLGGSSVMRWTIAPPADTLDYGERLVAEIGLEGYAEAEFRRDARGTPLLMEVNARLSQSVEVATRAGVDFPRMQLEWARGGRVEPVNGYRVGLRVGWVAGEARVLAAAGLGAGPAPRPRLRPTLAGVARDYLTRKARFEGFDTRDPRPSLAALSFTAGTLRRRGTRRPSGSPG